MVHSEEFNPLFAHKGQTMTKYLSICRLNASIVSLFWMAILSLSIGNSQVTHTIGMPEGDITSRAQANSPLRVEDRDALWDEERVSLVEDALVSKNARPPVVWHAPFGTDIIAVESKRPNRDIVFILLSDGSVYESVHTYLLGWDFPTYRSKVDPAKGYVGYGTLVGDALYYQTSSLVYVSRDTARTWQVDTVGVGSVYKSGIAVDTAQFVYLSTDKGLYKQHPDSSIWRKVSTFTQQYLGKIFIDRQNRIYLNGTSYLYLSTDRGGTWTIDTAGFGNQPTRGYAFCDDAYGNVYAYKSMSIWRSANGTQPWMPIGQTIFSQIADPSVFQYSTFINTVSGDSTLFVGTAYGLYASTDQGNTWTFSRTQLSAGSIYGFIRTANGKFITSTNLAVYSRNIADTFWTKSFPASGCLGGRPIYRDNANILYTLGSRINSADNTSIYTNWRSTDGGTSWVPDTAGLGTLGKSTGPVYFVDELGTQHYASSNFPAMIYSKLIGKSWAPDTNGYTLNVNDLPVFFGTDRRGYVYVQLQNLTAGTNTLWKRPVAGGAWKTDTVGLGYQTIYSMASAKNGNLIVGTFYGIFMRSGGTWGSVPMPPSMNGYNCFVVSVDSTGAIIAGFSTFSGFTAFWRGVYATKDYGTTWTKLGLDSIAVRGLVSYGDTTYAYTYYDGVYQIRSTGGGLGVPSTGTAPRVFALEQNYPNPFNPSTVISYQLSAASTVTLKIYDLLGREVATPVNEEQPAGWKQVRWDATGVASGIYFYELRAGNFRAVKKMVMVK